MIRVSEGSPIAGDIFSIHLWKKVLWRRKYTVLLCLCLGIAVTFGLTMNRPKNYVAEAVVALDARKIQVLPTDEVVSRLPQESPVLRTELDVISSRSMAESVLHRLPAGVFDVDEGAAHADRPWRWAHDQFVEALDRYGVPIPVTSGRQDAAGADPDRDATRELVDRLIAGLSVLNDGRSFTIFISYRATDPVLAAQIANAYAQAYIDQQIASQASGTRTASDWLGMKVDDLRARLERSEEKVQAFRQENGLIEVGGATPQVHRLNTLSAELSAARSARAAAEARLAVAIAAADEPNALQSFAEVLSSPVIQELRDRRSQTVGSMEEIRGAGALKSARLPALEGQLSALDAAIAEEIRRILDSLEHEVSIAGRKEQDLEAAVRGLENDLARDSLAMVELNRMQREVSANSAVYESFLSRYKQSIEQQGLALPEARVITWAEPPVRPASSRLPAMFLGMVFGLGAGVSLAFARDRLDRRVRSAAELEERTDVPVLAFVPRCRRTLLVPPQMHPVARPLSPYSVAIRKLCTTLRVSPMTASAQVMLVSSSGLNEGKTTLALALARSYAMAGESVVIVDGNLSAPDVASAMGLNDPAGYLNSLLEDPPEGAGDMVSKDPWTNLSVVAAKPRPNDAGYLFGSRAFRMLISDLRGRFDIVIIDGPAISRSADATLLGSVADATLLSVRWGSTLEGDVASAIRHFALCDIAVAGLVIENIDPGAIADSEPGTIHRITHRPAAGVHAHHNGSGMNGNGSAAGGTNGTHPGMATDA